MRVIAGSARRTNLVTPRGEGTRPTTDRIKETLFNILQPRLYDASFLDLFAGSGGIGIEALSRGACEAVFVDRDREAISCIEENLRRTHLNEKASVRREGAMSALVALERRGRPFDLIFMDPPYGKGLEEEVLRHLAGSSLVDAQTWIIVEAKTEEDFSYLDSLGFRIEKEKIYGSNKHLFLTRNG